MSRTFFQDFARDDGSPVTVEYSFQGGTPTTYSPMYGADGGDGCEVEIVDVMPATPEYDALCSESLMLRGRNDVAAFDPDDRVRLGELDDAITLAKKAVALTDAEYERMCDWLAAHHLDEPEDDDIF